MTDESLTPETPNTEPVVETVTAPVEPAPSAAPVATVATAAKEAAATVVTPVKKKRSVASHGVRAAWRLTKIAIYSAAVLGSSDVALKAGYASYEAASSIGSVDADLAGAITLGSAWNEGWKLAWNHDYYKFDPRFHITGDFSGSGLAQSGIAGGQYLVGYGFQALNTIETLFTASVGTGLGWALHRDYIAPAPAAPNDQMPTTRQVDPDAVPR